MPTPNRCNLTWPPGLPETRTRRVWFDRLSALPPGLTLRQVAERFGRRPRSVWKWVRAFGYPAGPDGTAALRAAADRRWARVDWAKQDAAIAADLGVTRERVRQRRRARGLPPSQLPAEGDRLRAWAAAHAGELHGRTVADILRAAGGRRRPKTAGNVLRASGVRPARSPDPRTLPVPDWRLGNLVLSDLWATDRAAVGNRRKRAGAGRPLWDGRRDDLDADPDYRRAVRAERARAAAWRARAGKGRA